MTLTENGDYISNMTTGNENRTLLATRYAVPGNIPCGERVERWHRIGLHSLISKPLLLRERTVYPLHCFPPYVPHSYISLIIRE